MRRNGATDLVVLFWFRISARVVRNGYEDLIASWPCER
ncbi:hypothetical protein GFS60_07568 (plasmid) [Rhodococcus sp. WAY2]|nr:hypothetical protein GFS60_07568 [Rhodococcus sp. WAY2]